MKQSMSLLAKFCLSGMLLAVTVWQPFPAQDDTRETEVDYTIYTVAGTGKRGFSGDGGPAVDAQLARPHGLAVDPDGNLYIADVSNHRIRRVDPSGTITTIAGTGTRGYSGDNGPANRAQLQFPRGVAVDRAGNLYIADSNNRRIRQVDPSGIITTFAGTGEEGPSGDGGPAVQAEIGTAERVTVERTGNLYFSVGSHFSIRRVDPSGIITTFAGIGEDGGGLGDGGPAVEASLVEPRGVRETST